MSVNTVMVGDSVINHRSESLMPVAGGVGSARPARSSTNVQRASKLIHPESATHRRRPTAVFIGRTPLRLLFRAQGL